MCQQIQFISVTHPRCLPSQLNMWGHVKEAFHTSPEKPTSLLCPGTSDLPSKNGKDQAEKGPQDNAEDDRHWKPRADCGRAAGAIWVESKRKQVENHVSQRAAPLQPPAVPMGVRQGTCCSAMGPAQADKIHQLWVVPLSVLLWKAGGSAFWGAEINCFFIC